MNWIVRHPFTVLLFSAIFLVGVVTRVAIGSSLSAPVQARWGVGAQQLFENKRWWTIFTMVFLCSNASMLYGVIVAGVPALGLAESILGTRYLFIAYWATQIIVWLLMAVAFRSLMRAGIGPGPTVYPMTDVGLSVGLFGVFGVFLWRVWHHPQLIAPWQLYGFTAGVFLYLIVKSLLAPEWLADTGHWSALVLGMIIGMLF